MVYIGRAVGPLVGARQRAFAIMFVEAEGRDGTDFDLFGELCKLRRIDSPIVERGLKRRHDASGIGAFCQVFRDDDKAAVAGAVPEGGKFHIMSSSLKAASS